MVTCGPGGVGAGAAEARAAALQGHAASRSVPTPVTQVAAQALQVVTPPSQAPPHRPEVAQALQTYRAAMQTYHATTRRPWPLLPPAPDLRVRHLWRRVEVTKRQ